MGSQWESLVLWALWEKTAISKEPTGSYPRRHPITSLRLGFVSHVEDNLHLGRTWSGESQGVSGFTARWQHGPIKVVVGYLVYLAKMLKFCPEMLCIKSESITKRIHAGHVKFLSLLGTGLTGLDG
jgi:hypothetical protein